MVSLAHFLLAIGLGTQWDFTAKSMIVCSVCKAENGDLDIVCPACKSFLQTRVDTLDLFGTIWQLIDSPLAAFKRIVLSQHKNYLLLLSSLFGMSIVYGVIWFEKLGNNFSNVLTLVGAGLLIGPIVGIIFVLALGFFSMRTTKALGGKTTFKNMSAVVAYSTIPIILSLVLVFPVEIAVFGLDFFGKNPPPMVIKPVAYVALLSMDFLAVGWFFLLLVEGTAVATGFSRVRSLIVTLASGGLAGLGFVVFHFV